MELPSGEKPKPYIERFTLRRKLNTSGETSPVGDKRVVHPFRYSRLLGADYIRLLHLEPASDNPSQLRGCLKVHKLNAQCEYEAISYAWGAHHQFDRELLLGNRVLKITNNLYAALMAYSYPNRTRVLWADAICINQTDTAEKTQQVAIMADIYSKAKTVQVWLAQASDWASDAMKFMANLSSRAESFGINNNVDHPRWINNWPQLDISYREATDLFRDAIEAHVDFLLFHPWFNRVWVVQEVTLAAKLVVSCGHTNMDWTPFARALEVLRGAYRRVPIGDERLKMEGIKPAWELVRHRDIFRLLGPHHNRNHHEMTNLAGRQMSSKGCSDDRDRVYAMLAMTIAPQSMTPDYNKTVAEAYTEFTRRYSPNTQIYWAGLARRRRREEADIDTENGQRRPIDITDRDYLPSWVPEFRPSLNLAWVSSLCGRYSAALFAPFYFAPHPEMYKVMLATGTLFDIIRLTSWKYDDNSAPFCAWEPGFYFSLINQLQDITRPPPGLVIKPSSEPPWLILAKTLTGGTSECEGAEFLLSRYPEFQGLGGLETGSLPWLAAIWDRFAAHCLAPTGEVFQHILLKTLGVKPRPLSPDGEVAEGFLFYLANILATTTTQLFVTTDGYVGLAPGGIRRGDFVALFNGCSMPYVVRAVEKVKFKGKVKYKGKGKTKENLKKKKEKLKFKDNVLKSALQVIGPCYLHGIMKGEIFTNRDAPHFSRLGWTRHDGDKLDSLEGTLVLI